MSFSSRFFFQNPLPLLLKISRYLEDDLEVYRILINSNGSEQFLIKLKKLFVQYMETDMIIGGFSRDVLDVNLQDETRKSNTKERDRKRFMKLYWIISNTIGKLTTPMRLFCEAT